MTYMMGVSLIALSCLNGPARVTVKEDSTIIELEMRGAGERLVSL